MPTGLILASLDGIAISIPVLFWPAAGAPPPWHCRVTHILHAIEHGDASAADELLPLVYEELCKLGAYRMANKSPDQTLQPTVLVHEAWLRLTGKENVRWNGRAHFFAAAAEAMRRILIDNARHKPALRHGGAWTFWKRTSPPAPATSNC